MGRVESCAGREEKEGAELSTRARAALVCWRAGSGANSARASRASAACASSEGSALPRSPRCFRTRRAPLRPESRSQAASNRRAPASPSRRAHDERSPGETRAAGRT